MVDKCFENASCWQIALNMVEIDLRSNRSESTVNLKFSLSENFNIMEEQ